MHKSNRTANFNFLQIIFDIFANNGSFLLSSFFYSVLKHSNLFETHIWICTTYNIVFILCMFMFSMYDITTFNYIDRIVQRTLVSSLISALCITLVIFLAKIYTTSRLLFLMFCVLSVGFVLSERFFILWCKKAHIGNGYTHVLFIGDEKNFDKYLCYSGKTSMKIKVEKFISSDEETLKSWQFISELITSMNVDEVVVVYSFDSANSKFDLSQLIKTCEVMGITVRLLLVSYETNISRKFVSSLGTYPVITYHSVSFDKLQLFIKMLIDIIGSAIGLVLTSWMFLLVAIAIKLDSPGPVFFKQVRVGINGKPFKMYKFRSMYIDAEERKKDLMAQNKIRGGLMFKMDNDPRITRVGRLLRKTSIDELPQLINVLKRDMSLVGTRPPTLDEVSKYSIEHRRRISIMPGITGMWQVSGRSEVIDFENVVNLDKKYIDEWSLALDIKLLLKTITAVLRQRGAS